MIYDTIAEILSAGAFSRQQADALRKLFTLIGGGGSGNSYMPGGW